MTSPGVTEGWLKPNLWTMLLQISLLGALCEFLQIQHLFKTNINCSFQQVHFYCTNLWYMKYWNPFLLKFLHNNSRILFMRHLFFIIISFSVMSAWTKLILINYPELKASKYLFLHHKRLLISFFQVIYWKL